MSSRPIRQPVGPTEPQPAGAVTRHTGREPDDVAVTSLARYVLELPQPARQSRDPMASLDRVIRLLKRGWGP